MRAAHQAVHAHQASVALRRRRRAERVGRAVREWELNDEQRKQLGLILDAGADDARATSAPTPRSTRAPSSRRARGARPPAGAARHDPIRRAARPALPCPERRRAPPRRRIDPPLLPRSSVRRACAAEGGAAARPDGELRRCTRCCRCLRATRTRAPQVPREKAATAFMEKHGPTTRRAVPRCASLALLAQAEKELLTPRSLRRCRSIGEVELWCMRAIEAAMAMDQARGRRRHLLHRARASTGSRAPPRLSARLARLDPRPPHRHRGHRAEARAGVSARAACGARRSRSNKLGSQLISSRRR